MKRTGLNSDGKVFAACALVLLTLCLSRPQTVNAQWTIPDTNGNINTTSTGNVGIGITVPAAKIHIKTTSILPAVVLLTAAGTVGDGASFASFSAYGGSDLTSNYFRFFYTNTSAISSQLQAPNRGYVMSGADATNGMLFVTQASAPIIFATGGMNLTNERMRIDSSGNLGLGTATPLYKLDVAGQIRSSSGGFVFPNGTVQMAAASGTISGVTAGSGLTGGGTSGVAALNIGAGTGLTVAADSVSVNYGSTTGTAVQGSTSVTVAAGPGMTGGGALTLGTGGTLTLTNSDKGSDVNIFKNVANASGVTQFSAGSPTDSIKFEGTGGTSVSFDVSAKKVTIGGGSGSTAWSDAGLNVSLTTSSDNVGIGTPSPLTKLHVVGNVRVDGTAGRVYLGTEAVSGSRGFEIYEENPTTFSLRHHDPAVGWRNIAIAPYLGGNVGIGNLAPNSQYKLDVTGNTNVTGDFTTTGTITGGIINAKYQDVAEWVESSQKLSAGTVVVLDHTRSNQVVASAGTYDTRVAGVVSAKPGVILGEGGQGKLMVATTGRVRMKVDATRSPIGIGDLLVTGNGEGFAMKSIPIDFNGTPIHRPGTIIGKALEPLEKGTGEILVLLSLQ